MAEETTYTFADMFKSRKFVLTITIVGLVLLIGIIAAVLKQFGIDVTELANWAMVTIAGSGGAGVSSIALEDGAKAKAAASVDVAKAYAANAATE